MANAGLSSAQADTLYRGLFVYTVGFFETQKQLTTQNTSP